MIERQVKQEDWNGWALCGNGPSYLLFTGSEVYVLRSDYRREIQVDTQKLDVFDPGTRDLRREIYHLSRIYGGITTSIDDSTAYVKDWIARILYMREDKDLAAEIRLLGHSIKAANRLKRLSNKQGGKNPFEFDRERLVMWTITANDERMSLIKDYGLDSQRHFFCEVAAKSSIGVLAQNLKRAPTKKELRDKLGWEASAISRYCREQGFSWLPNAAAGRPRKG